LVESCKAGYFSLANIVAINSKLLCFHFS